MSSYVQIPPGGPAGRVWSGRFYKFLYTDPTRLCLRRHATRPAARTQCVQYMSRLSGGQVYDQTKSADVCGDASGRWVWSGRVRLVEFTNDTTRPDQRQSGGGRL